MISRRRQYLRVLVYCRAYRRRYGREPIIGCDLVWPDCMKPFRKSKQ